MNAQGQGKIRTDKKDENFSALSGRTIKRALLSFLAIIVCLLFAELLLRLMDMPAEWKPRHDMYGAKWNFLLHRPSQTPGLLYELRPGVSGSALGVPVKINSLGARGEEIKVSKPRGVKRIVALGDSITFGWKVEREDIYVEILEDLLNRETGKTFQVVNMATSGYNTAEEVALFMARGKNLDPHMVIIGYSLNDPGNEPFQPLRAYYQHDAWWKKSNLVRMTRKLWWKMEIYLKGGGDYFVMIHNDDRHWQSVTNAFERMGTWSDKTGVPVLVAIFPQPVADDWEEYPYQHIHCQVAEAASEHGLQPVDLYEPFSEKPPRNDKNIQTGPASYAFRTPTSRTKNRKLRPQSLP